MVASPVSACRVMHVSSNYGTQVPGILCLGFVMSSIVVPVIVNYMDASNSSTNPRSLCNLICTSIARLPASAPKR